MLRTIAIRNERLICSSFRRLSKGNTLRCVSTQLTKRTSQPRHVIGTTVPKPAIWKVQLWRNYCSNLPSHTKVTLPALSPTMESGTIVSWEKKEGDKLNEGDLLAEIETDKATMGFETPEEGYLAKILIQAGTKDVAIGKLVCIIVENQSDIAAFADFKDAGGSAAAPTAPAPTPAAHSPPPPLPSPAAADAAPPSYMPTASQPHSPAGGRVYASPMAKRLAETQQLRLEGQGSGMYGSITSKDLAGMKGGAPGARPGGRPVATGPPSGATFHDVPVSTIRDVIAKRLLESKTQIPHYYLSMEINVDELLKIRANFNKKLEKEGVKLSINDFVIKAVASSCRKVPEVNSSWMDKFIRMYDSVDCSIAVDSDKGLITPIVFQADRKGLIEISQTVKVLAAKAREGKLQPNEFQGGTISISNLGMFGISDFCAIINPPQSCILAVGGLQKRLIAVGKDKDDWKESDFITVTLSCDHRTVDGALGARWLQHFKHCLEFPAAMLL